MSYAGGAATSAAAAAIGQALKASGVIVKMEPDEFGILLDRIEEPLVVMATGGVISKNFQYLTSHKGLAFYAKSQKELFLPPKAELIMAKQIWIPA